MKTERFDYLHLLFGILCGFLLGSSLNPSSSIIIRRILFGFAIFVIAIYWRRIDSKAHKHHLAQWDILQPRGKWYFILTHYVITRGIILLVILVGPAASELHFSSAAFEILAFSGIPLVGLLIYLGYQEWNDCNRETQVQMLRQTAEVITSRQN